MKKTFVNPVTNKRQQVSQAVTLLGFDENGVCVYQEFVSSHKFNMAGQVIDAKFFVKV